MQQNQRKLPEVLLRRDNMRISGVLINIATAEVIAAIATGAEQFIGNLAIDEFVY